ncbi:MAG: RNA polymerase factor sigma-54 [Sphingobacteriia bacterium]|nr:RNA polymerase factor sigma-54 [Sphingobacteriia bacterium]
MPNLEQKQVQKVSQSLSITQSMQTSLKVLQFSNIELREFLSSELANNPFLQEDNEDENEKNDTSPQQNLVTERLGYIPTSGEFDIENIPAYEKTLKEHIIEQIYINFHSEKEKIIAFNLADYIDDSGYIKEEILINIRALGFKNTEINTIFSKLQTFDPPGVFARNLQECLKIQLKDQKLYNNNYEIILNNLELVAKGEITKLSKLTSLDPKKVMEYIGNIKKLNPKPGANFSSEPTLVVGPDVFMNKNLKGEWVVELNNSYLPKILINRKYYNLIKTNFSDKQEYKTFTDYYHNANALIQALDQRARTLLKVASQIVINQISFFEYGITSLKPMSIRLLAEQVGLHESTISRVCANKFILTPFGLLPFKFFFSKAIENNETGKEYSNKMISNLIKEIINNEAQDNILSDDDIVEILSKRKIKIARRTVAKYRNILHIPSSHERKQNLAKNKLQAKLK